MNSGLDPDKQHTIHQLNNKFYFNWAGLKSSLK